MTKAEKEIIAWLSRAYWLKIKIEKLQLQRAELQAMAEGVKAMDYGKVHTQGGDKTTLADAALGLIELDGKIAATIMRFTKVVDEITEAINRVNDERLSTLLHLRYVKGERWEQIAVAINYAWRQIHRLHHMALAAVSERMAHNGTRFCDKV